MPPFSIIIPHRVKFFHSFVKKAERASPAPHCVADSFGFSWLHSAGPGRRTRTGLPGNPRQGENPGFRTKAAAKPSPQPLSCASQRASRPEPGADVPTIRPCRSSDLCLRRQDPLPSQVAPMTGLRQRGRCLDTYSAGRAGIRTPLSCYSPPAAKRTGRPQELLDCPVHLIRIKGKCQGAEKNFVYFCSGIMAGRCLGGPAPR